MPRFAPMVAPRVKPMMPPVSMLSQAISFIMMTSQFRPSQLKKMSFRAKWRGRFAEVSRDEAGVLPDLAVGSLAVPFLVVLDLEEPEERPEEDLTVTGFSA